MSAFILSDKHFSVIAYAIEGLNPLVNPQELANKLKRINIESVNYRYNEKTRVSKCKLQHTGKNYSIADIIRLISCWNYQSCENQGSLDYIITEAFLFSFFDQKTIDDSRNNSDLWSIE